MNGIGEINHTTSCSQTFPYDDGTTRYELISTSSGSASGCNYTVYKYTKVWQYKRNCSTCGCDTWGDFGDWSDASSCSSGESSDHQTTTGCRTLYY